MFPWMFFPMMLAPKLPKDNDKPPTLYALLNSIVNYDKPESEQAKIKELTTLGRSKIFDFNYPLSDKVNKEEFEINILNHFLMRRIGYDTFTSWQIALNSKLNEIMPMYNKILDSFEDWDLLNSGEDITRTTKTTNEDVTNGTNNVTNKSSSIDNLTSNNSKESTSNNTIDETKISDRRYSDTPQNKLTEVQDGDYVSNYNYDTDTDSSTNINKIIENDNVLSNNKNESENITNGSNNTVSNGTQDILEKISRTPLDKINIYKQYIETTQSVYSMIYKELDSLFYQLV